MELVDGLEAVLTSDFAIADYCLSPEPPDSLECAHFRLTKRKPAVLSFADMK